MNPLLAHDARGRRAKKKFPGSFVIQCVLFQVALNGAFLTRHVGFYAALIVISLFLLMQWSHKLLNIGITIKLLFLAFGTSLLLTLPWSIFRNWTAVAYLYMGACVFVLAVLMSRDANRFVKASKATLALFQIWVIFSIVLLGLDNYPLDRLFVTVSSNAITSQLILLQAIYCLISYAVKRRIPVLTPWITLAICFVGYGRGSLVAAVGMLLILLFFRLIAPAQRRTVFIRFVIATVSAVVLVVYVSSVAEIFTTNTKLFAGFADEHRTTMIADYLKKMDGLAVVVGTDYTGTSIAHTYNGNPHNSYIRAHQFFGLPYLFFVIFLPIVVALFVKNFRLKMFALAMWGVVFFRAFTEPILFPTLLDFYVFAASMILLSSHQTSNCSMLGKIQEEKIRD